MKPPPTSEPPADDLAEFRKAVGDVRPLAAPRKAAIDRPAPTPEPRSSQADERAVMQELLDRSLDALADETGEALSYRADGIQEQVFRRLRRGAYRISDEIDLHGLTWDEAKLAVAGFLAASRARDVRCVRIIHGKGVRSSAKGPVLKAYLDAWLRRRQDVLAFTSAQPRDGGLGALYVLLRRE